MVPGKWKTSPFGLRQYDPIKEYVATKNISEEEGQKMLEQLKTPLQGYLGLAYNYDDHSLAEEWMVVFQDRQTERATADEVIRIQTEGLMEIMIQNVQDRVLTEAQILEKAPLQLGKDIIEIPVWGIDCYTRRMVEISIEDRVPKYERDFSTVNDFIEHCLLPAINAQPSDRAFNMYYATISILEVSIINSLVRVIISVF